MGVQSRRVSRTTLAIAILAALIAASIGVAAVRRAPRRSWPAHWDPRVTSLVGFVERQRAMRFDHPVEVRLLTPAAMRGQVRGSRDGAPSPAEAQEIAAELRALGLAGGNVDVTQPLGTLVTRSRRVHGLYDPVRKVVFVDSPTLTAEARTVLAHELTHALQDQHLGLRTLNTRTDRPNDVIRSVSEGDAVVVQAAYAEALPPDERAAYETSISTASALEAQDVPAVLVEEAQFPYVFGELFMRSLRAAGGLDAANQAFRRVPKTEAEILDPDRYLHHDVPKPIDAPRLASGERGLRPARPLGQGMLFRMLSGAVGYGAWRAVRGWDGDMGVVTRRGGAICAAVAVRVDPATADDFAAAARAWAEPVGTIERRGATFTLRRCDPGTAYIRPVADPTPYTVLSSRAAAIGALEADRIPYRAAVCIVDRLINAAGQREFVALADRAVRSAATESDKAMQQTARAACAGAA